MTRPSNTRKCSVASMLGVFAVFSIAAFLAMWTARCNRKLDEANAKRRLTATLGALSTLDKWPSRCHAGRSWRLVCVGRFEAKLETDERDEHPYFCTDGNGLSIVAIDYPGSPWGGGTSPALALPIIMVLEFSHIRWPECGDLVYKQNTWNDNDQLLVNRIQPTTKYVVGFSDWSTRVVSGYELIQLCHLENAR